VEVEYPSNDEILINNRLFGKCSHPCLACELKHTKEDRYEFEYKYLVCTCCGKSFEHPKEGGTYLDDSIIPKDYLTTKIEKYSQSPFWGERILRKIDELGWEVRISENMEGVKCKLSKDNSTIDSDNCENEQIALSSAAAKLAAKL